MTNFVSFHVHIVHIVDWLEIYFCNICFLRVSSMFPCKADNSSFSINKQTSRRCSYFCVTEGSWWTRVTCPDLSVPTGYSAAGHRYRLSPGQSADCKHWEIWPDPSSLWEDHFLFVVSVQGRDYNKFGKNISPSVLWEKNISLHCLLEWEAGGALGWLVCVILSTETGEMWSLERGRRVTRRWAGDFPAHIWWEETESVTCAPC